MSKVAIVMGSDSDFPKMEGALTLLKRFGVETEVRVISAHRTPSLAAEFAKNAKANGVDVIIAAAGLAAHLPGVLAAYTTLPVIGVPIACGALNGVDALYSIVQMPPAIPVATVAVDGACNAAVLAVQILAVSHGCMSEKLKEYREEIARACVQKDIAMQERLESNK